MKIKNESHIFDHKELYELLKNIRSTKVKMDKIYIAIKGQNVN